MSFIYIFSFVFLQVGIEKKDDSAEGSELDNSNDEDEKRKKRPIKSRIPTHSKPKVQGTKNTNQYKQIK